MNRQEIIAALPYKSPFLFVDEITSISDKGVMGNYTFRPNEFFYEGHFVGKPVTPGVILTEVMAQIGLVCLGIFLSDKSEKPLKENNIAFTSSAVEFYLPVFPGEKVTVVSEKEYFRFNKLKCKVSLYNASEELVCRGLLAGMVL
jgi:3-hydroxyacyl-[acyl-carrier-protein] dehydratase